MHSLLRFIETFKDYVVATALSLVSIFLIAHSDSPQIQVLRSLTVGAVATLQSSTGWVSSMLSARNENASLRTINMELMEELLQLRRVKQENAELRAMIGFMERSSQSLVPAEVVGKTFAPGTATLTINVGEADSVRVRMPVVTERGLVGKVIAVSRGYAIVQLAITKDFRATVKVSRSRIDGIIAWRLGEKLALQNIVKTADIRLGDTIITSEYSNTFPPDIPVGTVTFIGPGERGVFSAIDVQPHVQFQKLERVFVIRFAPRAEQQALEQRALPQGVR
ncbi:MAG: rod shape-determining protein MreC [Ignavibacteria bacterium]|nr:rod shape-determining protein MreC [Ignavibacteria bacterium]